MNSEPWYKTTLRWAQTNLVEIDPERYDSQFWSLLRGGCSLEFAFQFPDSLQCRAELHFRELRDKIRIFCQMKQDFRSNLTIQDRITHLIRDLKIRVGSDYSIVIRDFSPCSGYALIPRLFNLCLSVLLLFLRDRFITRPVLDRLQMLGVTDKLLSLGFGP